MVAGRAGGDGESRGAEGQPHPAQLPDVMSMPALIEQQLQNEKLSLLSEKNLTEALTQFVDKEETEAFGE